MRRKLTEQELAIEVVREFTSYPEDSRDDWGTLEDARTHTFEKGDLVAVETARGVRRALVLHCGRELSDFSNQWIQIYKVRLYNANGKIGNSYQWVYPGDIYRGFRGLMEQNEE